MRFQAASHRMARQPSPEKAEQDGIRDYWVRNLRYWLNESSEKVIHFRGSDRYTIQYIISTLVQYHRPYKITKHGGGVVTITTQDVSGKCLCCGAKDVTLCRLAQ